MTQARLLIVEDEGVLALHIERHLRSLGFGIVGVAASADEALNIVRGERPDLALVDIRIQGARDGIETAEQLRSDFDVPVVFLTAHGDAQTLRRAHATQPLGYLLKPFKNPDLQNVVTIAVARNMQERELRLRERLVSITLASVGEAILATDAHGYVTYMNRAAEGVTGHLASEGLGRPVSEVVELSDERSAESLESPVLRAIRGNCRVDVPGAALRAREGGQRLIVGTASPVSDGASLRGAVLVLRDLTELLTIRRQLEFADRLAALGTMAAGIAHEVNNPLAFLTSNLEYAVRHLKSGGAAQAEPLGGGDVVSALEEAIEGVRRVTQIVADLRALTQPPAEGVRSLDPRNSVRFALAVTSSEWKPRASLVLELEETPQVLADETRLGQVLVNLIINASHAMRDAEPRDHQLTIATRSTAAHEAVIEVTDTGVGMTPLVKQKIFEPFFTTKGAVGSGLGLPISLSIISRFGGRMEVDSSPGQGTTFRVILPGAPSA